MDQQRAALEAASRAITETPDPAHWFVDIVHVDDDVEMETCGPMKYREATRFCTMMRHFRCVREVAVRL